MWRRRVQDVNVAEKLKGLRGTRVFDGRLGIVMEFKKNKKKTAIFVVLFMGN